MIFVLQVMRRIAIVVVTISAMQCGLSWTAAAFAREHVPVFDRGAEIAAGRSSPTTAAVDMQTVRSDVDRLNNARNIYMMLTFLCDTILYFIAFCVFLCAIFIFVGRSSICCPSYAVASHVADKVS